MLSDNLVWWDEALKAALVALSYGAHHAIVIPQ